MKKFLLSGAALAVLALATPAFAADMPSRGPVYKAAPAAALFNWTGFYIGAHGGYGWGRLWRFQRRRRIRRRPDRRQLPVRAELGLGCRSRHRRLRPEGRLPRRQREDRSVRHRAPASRLRRRSHPGVRHRRSCLGEHQVQRRCFQRQADQYRLDHRRGPRIRLRPELDGQVEYLYADYGSDTYNVTVPTNVDLTTNTVKVGVNYLFGTGGGRW